MALKVDGPAVFSRSGVVTISYPSRSATVTVPKTPNAPDRPGTTMIATAQRLATGVYVQAAVPNGSHSEFTIYLNKAPGTASRPKSVEVAWFIVN